MKILYLPTYFYPEKAASPYLGRNRNKALIEAGYDIELFVPTPCRGISREVRKEFKKRRFDTLYDGHMRIHRFSMFAEGKNPLVRAIRYVLCCIKQFNRAMRMKDVSCVFVPSTPPIQGMLGAIISKLMKVPFVYNLQDIFPDSMVGSGLARKGGLIWKIGRKIEDFTYRHADRIIVISEDFKKNIMAKGVPEEKIRLIYNWVEEDAVVNIERKDNKLFEAYGLDRDRFYITYNGNIGLTQNLDMLVKVAKEMEHNEDIQFVLVGNGAYKKTLEKVIQEHESKNITLLPFQPYEDISHVFSLGDASLVISKPGVGANSVPSKTWSIMSASRPVIANFDENELKDIIEGNRCGIFTKAGDAEAFKNAIIELYNNRDLCMEYGRNGRQFVLSNLTSRVGASKYVSVINEVTQNKN